MYYKCGSVQIITFLCYFFSPHLFILFTQIIFFLYLFLSQSLYLSTSPFSLPLSLSLSLSYYLSLSLFLYHSISVLFSSLYDKVGICCISWRVMNIQSTQKTINIFIFFIFICPLLCWS